jgi:hypothetical protein
MLNAVPFEPDVALGWMERTARERFHLQPREGVRMFASVDGRPDLVQLQSDLSALSIFTRWWQHGHGSLKLYAEVCADARWQHEAVLGDHGANVAATPAQVRAHRRVTNVPAPTRR